MIEIKEGRYFIGMWFLAGDGHDFMLASWTDTEPKSKTEEVEWALQYRFRYYDEDDPSNDPFSGKDRKSGWGGTTVATEDEAYQSILKLIDRMVNLPRHIAARNGMSYKTCNFMPLFSSDPKFIMEQMQKQSWAHMKEMSKEEYEKEYGQKEEKEQK